MQRLCSPLRVKFVTESLVVTSTADAISAAVVDSAVDDGGYDGNDECAQAAVTPDAAGRRR